MSPSISQPKLFITTTVTDSVPKSHPLRSLRKLLDAALKELDDHFDGMCSDKAFDTHDYVDACRVMKFTPHFTQNIERKGGSAIDERTTRHPGYKISLRRRKVIEATFGWVR